jgi:soluble lytic murein transglycosylase
VVLVINLRKNKKVLLVILAIMALLFFSIFAIRRLFPLKYKGLIIEKSEAYGLDPAFVCAIIRAESRFNPNAVSHKGARGLMQVMEPTAYWAAEEIGLVGFDYSQMFEPETNIEVGCWYLANLNAQFGDTKVSLAAYNAGSGNVEKWLLDPSYSKDGKSLSYIPFKETRGYVKKIGIYEKIYGYLIRFL